MDKLKEWWNDSESPKGRFRLKEAAIIGALLLVAAHFMDSIMLSGWVTQCVIEFSQAGFANVGLYGVCRLVLHERTHDLQGQQKEDRQNTLVIAHGLVTAACFV